MKKKVVHVISHSHWDREWYMPLEHHKMRLLELIDGNLQLFQEDLEFKSFHLDGQTIVLDDYLEIKPQKKEEVKKAIEEGRFRVGPYYILQDEFLTSSEANVRNLQTGIREAKQYGNLTKVGYLPDAFGNAGQMPQIFKQAGMEAIAFGRGVRSVGFNNAVEEKGQYESTYSEMLWESPDGSALLGILFANWYSNGMEIPVDPVEAKAYWDARLASTEQYASTEHLLFMNGCDHQPVQKNLTAALETARKIYPDITFIHSTFEDYVNQLKAHTGDKLSVVSGELISQETDGWTTLVNTCSSHVYLKQRNRKNEIALERIAEPLSAWAAAEGKIYPHEQLQYAWKILMQNHPHDSICGCSVDQVNKEMEIRFDRSTQVAEFVADEAASHLVSKINTAGFADESVIPFVVFNTTGWERSQTVTVVLDVARDYQPDLHAGYGCMKQLQLPPYMVIDADGNPVDAVLEDVGVSFGYELPDDAFRKPYMARQVKVTMQAEKLPANGYSTYALCSSSRTPDKVSMVTGINRMENAYLSVQIAPNGTLAVTDKVLNRTYKDLCSFEDTLDAGNEYMYFCPPGNPTITTKESTAQIRLVEDTPFMASYEILHSLQIPVAADDQLAMEQRSMVRFQDRTCHRSTETTLLQIRTVVTLEKDARNLQIKTTVDNTARDHRLRVVIPTGLECSHHYAESVFEAAKRPNRHAACWKNPSGCEHQQSFVGLHDTTGGILVSNIGLYEYEMLPDEGNTVAVTLLRAVGELGDWGVFPTELSQQLRQITAEYQLSFFSGDLLEAEAYRDAYQFQTPAVVIPTDTHTGKLPLRHSFFSWQGERLSMTNCKVKDNETDRMVRFVNYSGEESVLTVWKDDRFRELYRSNIIEEQKELLHPDADGYYRIPVGKYEILTLGMKL